MASHSAALTSAWESQRRWSLVADGATKSIDTWRLRNLVLLGLGALIGALAAQDDWIPLAARNVLAILSAIVLALAALLQKTFLGGGQVKLHTTARAASEALKAEIFRYLVGVPPYATNGADIALSTAVSRVDDEAGEFLTAKASVTVDGKPLPTVGGIDDYVRIRAEGQRDWHNGRVASLEQRARKWRQIELLATGLAAVLAAVTSVAGFADLAEAASLGAWIGLATTVGGAVAAHIAASRYDKVASSYAHTASQLDRLIVDRQSSNPAPEDAAFVEAVEKVLAAQNGSWVVMISA